ncbi:hypothetical protein M409DRAFT_69251 [Zasmidium cellare ATCC 36951]|uniref:Methyltransferase domain-containing protein n=1 Tax=Zasmidium cellare ATCC 36951 TaxID=1080233 RepID=A0A6A6C5T7_ZASCE|nr:uncharacterized protein M409DRAFT_69251 [Zasmidium cellare ATCC 36951]KAF2162375.1 hypothetical protein M409DRAFT_69251 [Zasmidium cellare ATCC 36951]
MAVQTTTRLPLVLASVGIILFVGALLHQMNGVPSSLRSSSKGSFYDIALSHGTDKVTVHHYHHMYQKYLPPYRPKPLKMLEIGIGCDMGYGPGASYFTWLEYFPYVDLYFIEYDAACASKWAANTTGATIFTGDQANITFLNQFMRTAGTDFDVIVDDGGHTMDQQIVSLETLWKAVKPGGLYFCEDLQTSYWESYGGDPANRGSKRTMMGFVKELVDDLNVVTGGHKRKHEGVSLDLLSVDCMEEVCAFVKKG